MQKYTKEEKEENKMEYWNSSFINGDSSSKFIYPFYNFDYFSGTMMNTQQGLIHEHHVPLAMMESAYGEENNNINGHERKMKKNKKKMTSEQLQLLERSFQEETKLYPDRKMKLSKELGLQPRQIAVWFQNKKARWKNKQLEHLYKSLRQEFDVVSREKKLLQEEIVQLKLLIRENGLSNEQTWKKVCSEAMAEQFQVN